MLTYLVLSVLIVFTSANLKKDLIEKELFKVNRLSDLNLPGIRMHIQPRKSGIMKSLQANEPVAQAASAGRCDPKLVCITNPLTIHSIKSNQIAYPKCINMYRCGGCCLNSETCVAVKTQDILLKDIGIIIIESNNDIYFNETYTIVKNDTQCECKCDYQNDSDCKKLNQNYIKDEHKCGCTCPKSLQCTAFHEFEPQLCKCVCNKTKYSRIQATCISRGLKWNEITCQCEPMNAGQIGR